MTGQFKKDLKKYKYETTKLEDLKNILLYLQEAGTVPQRYKPHRLSGEYKDCMDAISSHGICKSLCIRDLLLKR